jgi:methionyl-tRNA formyltransferase
MRLVFLGTPAFALPALEHLLRGVDEVVVVYTQPDRPAGRGRELTMSPVKRFALDHSLPVYQPERLRRPEAVEQLRAQARLPYRRCVRTDTASGGARPAAHGSLNIHPSLLPATAAPRR